MKEIEIKLKKVLPLDLDRVASEIEECYKIKLLSGGIGKVPNKTYLNK